MAGLHPHTPILIGFGQTSQFWDGVTSADAPNPLGLQVAAANAALADTGASRSLTALIDHVFVVRSNLDSVEGARHPFGRCKNPPATLAGELGLSPSRNIYSVVGGDQPQALVNEAAESIFAGQAKAVLIAGSEATATMKQALKSKIKLNWSFSAEGEFEDRGLGSMLLNEYEIRNGLGLPTQTYPAFENALRARLGNDPDQHRRLMSDLWETFAYVAAQNPYSQFPEAKTSDFLATENKDNYRVADPYLKWHVAQDAVNQGAAVILTSVREAEKAGVDRTKWIFLHGYSSVKDRIVTERDDLSRSRAIEIALQGALEMAGKSSSEICNLDLYSCFPCAVLLAAEALEVDWRAKACTITGGLPFFGGAGNNYSMHAICTMGQKLRDARGEYGLVLANGGFLSKEAAGIYATEPVKDWQVQQTDLQARLDDEFSPSRMLAKSTEGHIETYTVTWKRGHPSRGYVIASTNEGRILARVRNGHRATLMGLHDGDPIGRKVTITHQNGTNFIEAGNRLGEEFADGGPGSRKFDHVLVKRVGHVLEVTMNRPQVMNALHSAAHFELHEIWDSFERDPDLWVAIITGAEDRAFCSGNDLKVKTNSGDMSMPATGFAGLCNRFDRTKPVIAAVNGVAMGGGLEIMLACDLAVAAENARFALPEVKVGLYAAAGGVQRLTRQIGHKAAMELILTGRQFDISEAEALRLINMRVEQGKALAAAHDLAARLMENSPSAIRASKEALNKLEEIESFEEALAANRKIFGKLMKTRDFREGVTAFSEKRKPRWSNS